MSFLPMALVVRARHRSGTSSLDLTIPVSIVKQLDIQPGELFSVKFEGKKNEEFELTYRRVIIERKK